MGPKFRLSFGYCPVEKPALWVRGQVAFIGGSGGDSREGQAKQRNPRRPILGHRGEQCGIWVLMPF